MTLPVVINLEESAMFMLLQIFEAPIKLNVPFTFISPPLSGQSGALPVIFIRTFSNVPLAGNTAFVSKFRIKFILLIFFSNKLEYNARFSLLIFRVISGRSLDMHALESLP